MKTALGKHCSGRIAFLGVKMAHTVDMLISRESRFIFVRWTGGGPLESGEETAPGSGLVKQTSKFQGLRHWKLLERANVTLRF